MRYTSVDIMSHMLSKQYIQRGLSKIKINRKNKNRNKTYLRAFGSI